MAFNRYWLRWVVLPGLFCLSGCADLAAVRSLASTAATTADYKQVVLDFESSGRRNARYKPADNPFITSVPAARAEESKRFEEVQAVLVNYLQALGELAAEGQPRLDEDVKDLVEELKKTPFIAQADKTANLTTLTAAGAIVGSLANLAVQGSREKKVKQLIQANDASVQVLVQGMARIVAVDFVGSLEEERGTANEYYQQVADRSAVNPGTKVLGEFLTRHARIEHDDATDARIAQAQAYAQILTKIGAGHAQLLAGLGNLHSDAVKASLKGYAEELKKLYQAMQDLK